MKNTSQKGFTLIEMLVTIAIFGLALGAVINFAIMNYRAHAFTLNQSLAIAEARKGVEIMGKELREATTGGDGSFIIESAENYGLTFYSDIDNDDKAERVRYFIFQTFRDVSSSNNCATYTQGGACQVNFANFTTSQVNSAEVEVCVEGDLDASNEYADISADGRNLGRLCVNGCGQCAGLWQGCTPYDVTSDAADKSVSFTADGSSKVGDWGAGYCDWEQANHSLKARFILSWSELDTGRSVTIYKGVTEPTAHPVTYPDDQEQVTILSKYVMNDLPLFRYFDENGTELAEPVTLNDIRMIRTHLIINVNPERPPQNFELESNVQIRNLKSN